MPAPVGRPLPAVQNGRGKPPRTGGAKCSTGAGFPLRFRLSPFSRERVFHILWKVWKTAARPAAREGLLGEGSFPKARMPGNTRAVWIVDSFFGLSRRPSACRGSGRRQGASDGQPARLPEWQVRNRHRKSRPVPPASGACRGSLRTEGAPNPADKEKPMGSHEPRRRRARARVAALGPVLLAAVSCPFSPPMSLPPGRRRAASRRRTGFSTSTGT